MRFVFDIPPSHIIPYLVKINELNLKLRVHYKLLHTQESLYLHEIIYRRYVKNQHATKYFQGSFSFLVPFNESIICHKNKFSHPLRGTNLIPTEFSLKESQRSFPVLYYKYYSI